MGEPPDGTIDSCEKGDEHHKAAAALLNLDVFKT